jgi:uncharacterized circularly permuted ATP-grasp superfamily protein/uncharacterized alpha-E superfamily protein
MLAALAWQLPPWTTDLAQTHFSFDLPDDVAALVAGLALPARPGHYDLLRAPDGSLRDGWRHFFAQLGVIGVHDLERRAEVLARHIREDGVTYNVYSEEGGPQRPWSLDLLPTLIGAQEWAGIEAGVAQRAALLAAIMGDVYGEQHLLRAGLLPAALVHGNPGYLRPLVGAQPAGGLLLHIVGFDLARAPDGRWWVVAQRTQAPSGLGYVLQNRLIVSRLFPEAFRELRVQRLASTYRRLLDTLDGMSPRDAGERGSARIVLLTPGPYNETYFEHAYLARYLGIPLVEGGDLAVRDERVYLKTLHGLERVHAILRRLDDDFCDPLELRADSTLGVPGLLQAIRAGQVLVANALGSGFLESPAIHGFLPAIAEHLQGTRLLLPSLNTWWCGEAAAFEAVADALHDKVVKPTYAATPSRPGFDTQIGATLGEAARRALRERIAADPDAYTVQDYLPLPQAPTWSTGRLQPRAAMLRVYAISDGAGGWHALPGGMTRVAGREQMIVSMQRGGSSQDIWVQTEGTVDEYSMLPEALRPEDIEGRRRVVSSRAAENLYWMGRYAERAEFSARLLRAVLTLLADEARGPSPLLDAIEQLAADFHLVPPGTPSPTQSLAVFERTLIAGLADPGTQEGGVEFNLESLLRTAGQLRERLSGDHWRLLVGTVQSFREARRRAQADGVLSSDEALSVLRELSVHLHAVTGAQTDHMTHDDGWRLMTIGRQIERLSAQAHALQVLFATGAAQRDEGFDLLLVLFDSTITYRSRYQRTLEMPAVIDLLVQEQTNPRALARIVHVLRRELERLPPDPAMPAARLPSSADWPTLTQLCAQQADGRFEVLARFADSLANKAYELSDDIVARYFSHAAGFRTLNA